MENEKNKEIEIDEIQVDAVEINKIETKGFFARLISSIVDQCIVVACSLILILIMDGILRLAGYYIDERVPIFFILYVLANIIYPTIMQGTRFKTTFGNKLFR